MMQIEAFSYKELLLKNMINGLIKKMLPHYSKDADLDNFIFGFYGGEQRLEGANPTAPYEFSIEEPLNVDITIPKGLELSDGVHSAYLYEDVVILAGELSVNGKLKLNQKVKTSTIKTEIVVSPYPYVVSAKSLGDFTGGSDVESDKDFLSRAILGLYKYSTAGGEKAYIYFAKTADERVFDVKVHSPNPMVVNVYILPNTTTPEATAEVMEKVEAALKGDEKTQAFCDVVNVIQATKKSYIPTATIQLFDLSKQADILKTIKENFTNSFKIDEDLPYSSIITKMHIGGVYKVSMEAMEDITTDINEYISITEFNLTFVEASL
jgi:phage-related baseplate assembly protein